MLIEIIANGQVINAVTPQTLHQLAAEGAIDPETTIRINGKLGRAGQLQGLVFCTNASTYPTLPDNVSLLDSRNVPMHSMSRPMANRPSTYNANTTNSPIGSSPYPLIPQPPMSPGYGGFHGVPSDPPVVQYPVYVQQPVYMLHSPSDINSSGIGVAVISLVMGALGLIAWIIPLVGFLIAIIGIVCGCIGISSSGGRGLAIGGIILCSIGMIFSTISWIANMIIMANMGLL